MNTMRRAHLRRPNLIEGALNAVRRWTQHLRQWIHEAIPRAEPMERSHALVPIRIQHARPDGDVSRRIGH